jgi:molybdenum cofactor synthesis domain-containing protein
LASSKSVTACVLIIGNEILSGRTQDINLNYISKTLGKWGIQVREARVIPDVEETIIETLNSVRKHYDYVFTTGGIGPTHDDITAVCIAKAFNKPVVSTDQYSPGPTRSYGISLTDGKSPGGCRTYR